MKNRSTIFTRHGVTIIYSFYGKADHNTKKAHLKYSYVERELEQQHDRTTKEDEEFDDLPVIQVLCAPTCSYIIYSVFMKFYFGWVMVDGNKKLMS